MKDATNQRKLDHLNIAADDSVDRQKNYFDAIQLIHRALPGINQEDIDPSVTFLGKKLSFPLLISSMTGGDDEQIRIINKNLASAAEKTGIALAVGSQRVMFDNPGAAESFNLRQYAPTTLLLSNLGAVQLNYGFTEDHCRKAIEILDADGIYLHLNALQEVIQNNGDTRFSGLAQKIGAVAKAVNKPVLVKEVGAGLGLQDIDLLIQQDIRYFDVAGAGGTSWSRIEQHRRACDEAPELGTLFQDWGHPTPAVLQQLGSRLDDIQVIASGGIRTGLDMAKAMILGASLCGIARPFLKPATESAEAVIKVIQRLKKEFITTMFLLGVDNTGNLQRNRNLMRGENPA